LGVTTTFTALTLLKLSDRTSVIDEITSSITVSLIARQMSSSDISITSDSNIVFNYPTLFNFKINNKNDLPKYSFIKIYLPKSIQCSDSIYCMYSGLSVGCSCDQGNNIVIVNYISSGVILSGSLKLNYLQIGNMYNPISSKATNTFEL
jgi:hypothetical protein